MSVSPYRVLEYAVTAYDEYDRPLVPTVAAERLETEPGPVADHIEMLVDCDLLAPVEGGYRPTVTGRELLELDIEGDLVVVDASRDEAGCGRDP